METLRSFTHSAITQLISVLRLTQYCLLFPFTPALETLMKGKFLECDIKVNGKRAWDIQIKDRRFYAQVAVYGPLGMGQAFLDGWWDSEDLEEFIFRLVNKGVLAQWYQMPWNRLGNYLQNEWLNLQSKQRAQSSCNSHYNFGMDFFEHFLDSSMSYSVAYWKTAKTLEEAQKDKMELVAQKLNLEPGMRVLDLGCGFGGLSKFLAENYSVQVVGITNSTKMGEAASKKCEGLPVQIQIIDWRDIKGTFDRVVCIEMVLHVGKHNLDAFFKQVPQWFKDPEEGVFVMQDFSAGSGIYGSDEFLGKYFFPGAYCGQVEEIVEKAGKYLTLEGYQDMSMDCVETGRAMFKGFDKCWPEIEKEYGARIYKSMRYFFIGAGGFSRAKRFLTHQMVFKKIP